VIVAGMLIGLESYIKALDNWIEAGRLSTACSIEAFKANAN